MPLYPEVLQAKECAQTSSSSDVFTFGFTFESIKEFGCALAKVVRLIKVSTLTKLNNLT